MQITLHVGTDCSVQLSGCLVGGSDMKLIQIPPLGSHIEDLRCTRVLVLFSDLLGSASRPSSCLWLHIVMEMWDFRLSMCY